MQQPVEMSTREEETATVSLTGTDLKAPRMDWSEDINKDFIVFKTFAKMWLEMKDVPDHKQFMFML